MGVSVVSPVTEVVRLTCGRSPRVTLLTDAAPRDMVPESIRSIADKTPYGELSSMGAANFPGNADGAVIWCKGEVPLAGSPADWRRPFFFQPNGNTCVAVHWSYLEHADLLGLEPRLLRVQATPATLDA